MGIFRIKLKLTVPRMQFARGNMQIYNLVRKKKKREKKKKRALVISRMAW